MLANGATLKMKKDGETTYVDLPGLKTLPDIGIDPEKVENTCLTDSVKKYENGIGEPGDMTYTFKYVNSSDTDSYRLLRAVETSGKAASFKETLKDGTVTTFDAQVAVKRTSAGVNGAMEFTASLSLQSDIEITDPA